MAEIVFSSPAIAKEIQKRYGNKSKVIKINMRHEEEVKDFVMKIEKAHKNAANSKLPAF